MVAETISFSFRVITRNNVEIVSRSARELWTGTLKMKVVKTTETVRSITFSRKPAVVPVVRTLLSFMGAMKRSLSAFCLHLCVTIREARSVLTTATTAMTMLGIRQQRSLPVLPKWACARMPSMGVVRSPREVV